MPIIIIAGVVLALAILAMILLAVLAPRLFDRPALSPAEAVRTATILDRIAAEGSLLYGDSWQLEPSHRRPDEPYSIEQAHREMQRHRMCSADSCGAKSAAMSTLEIEGVTHFDDRAAR
ncbi:hypothetical protein [Nocardia brasiliensis]|uniref:hypothetical protein n=1 Tax=Nocardia brasiliensis TaxID=37326 RepID=UPI002457A76B|nr:hypothetical protein [Nocardia brasiliensis]